jgi:hypothetical protein
MKSTAEVWDPQTELEKQAVRDQLERVLAHSAFRGSKRCSDLLRYIVESRLRDPEGQLKERVLGAEVFGRKADYDTSEDIIVRHTSSDIRKRIAQYYFESGHQSEIRIDLPSGSYVPEFTLPVQNLENPPAPPSGIVAAESFPPALPPAEQSRKVSPLVWTASSLVLLALLSTVFWSLSRYRNQVGTQAVPLIPISSESTTDLFWKPILDDPARVLICLEKPHVQITGGSPRATYVTLADAELAMRLVELLIRKNKRFEISLDSSITAEDLSQGPAILIGEGNNLWLERAMDSLRFHLTHSADYGVLQIEDRENPSKQDWSVRILDNDVVPGYAILARFRDPKTKHWVVAVASTGGNSMKSAGDVLMDSKYLGSEMARENHKNWPSSNIEVVVKTQLVNGDPGPPGIIALNVW